MVFHMIEIQIIDTDSNNNCLDKKADRLKRRYSYLAANNLIPWPKHKNLQTAMIYFKNSLTINDKFRKLNKLSE